MNEQLHDDEILLLLRRAFPGPDEDTLSPDGAQARAVLGRVLDSGSLHLLDGAGSGETSDALAASRVRRRRLRRSSVAVLVVGVAAAAVALPFSLGSTKPPADRDAKVASPVMALGSYRLRLPASYHLTAASASSCPVPPLVFPAPSFTPPGPQAGQVDTPEYASDVATQANAQGGCLLMVLAPSYIPTASDPDPEIALLQETQPVQVGQYQGHVGTSRSGGFTEPADQYAMLYVQIPLSGGQDRDLVVSSYGLSPDQLVSLVATGLSVSSDSPTAGAPFVKGGGGTTTS